MFPVVTSITKISSGCSVTEDKDGKEDLEYEEVYRVVFDSPARAELARIASKAGIFVPRRGARYVSLLAEKECFAKNISSRMADAQNAKVWDVTVKYTPDAKEKTPGDDPAATDPEAEFVLPRTKISKGSESRTYNSDRDAEGRPYMNSAGQYFDPGMQLEDGDISYSIVNYSLKTIDDAKIAGKIKGINKDPFMGKAPKTCKFAEFNETMQEFEHSDGSITDYFEQTFTIVYRPTGWTSQVLDQGTVELETEAGSNMRDELGSSSASVPMILGARVGSPKKQLTDNTGRPASHPVALDGKGKKLAAGASPVYLPFKEHKEVTFGEIGINTVVPKVGAKKKAGPSF